MHKKISVVIPTYQRPNLLLSCLKALKKQTLPVTDFEVIVVHDGPETNMKNKMSVFAYKNNLDLHYLNTEIKKGPAAARNLGWLSAKSNLIAFTDDDCRPSKNWLASIVNAYHGEELIAFTGKTIVPLPPEPTDYELNTAKLSTADFITANCACTKNALIKIGGFDEAFKLAWREDSDVHFKLIKYEIPILALPSAIVIHPVRSATWGISLKEQKKGIYDALLLKKHPRLYHQKIRTKPLYNYYAILFSTVALFVFLFLGWITLSKILGVVLVLLIGNFSWKRLQHAKKSVSHVAEIILTSIAIPFVSLYWHYYGRLKFRKI